MLRPLIRWAKPTEGNQIEALLIDNGLCPTGLDWSNLQGWMVAEHNDAIVGVIQVLPGKPLGHIGYLAVIEALQNQGIGYWLWKEAEYWLGTHGMDGYTGMTITPSVLKAFTRSGGTIFGDPVNFLIKRVVQRTK